MDLPWDSFFHQVNIWLNRSEGLRRLGIGRAR